MTIAAGETITAADINGIKDDVDAILSANDSTVSASETTASTAYTDLATSGPSVTITTGTKALVAISAQVSNSGANSSLMSVAISGATTKTAGTYPPFIVHGTEGVAATQLILITNLTAGSNTFTAKYRVAGGTGTWSTRALIVIPLGA